MQPRRIDSIKPAIVLKTLAQPGCLVFVLILFLAWFNLSFLYSWPYVLFLLSMATPVIAINLIAFLYLLAWNLSKKVITHRSGLMLSAAKVVIIVNILFSLFICTELGSRSYLEIAGSTINDVDYHVVFQSGCIESCGSFLELYSCKSIKWTCFYVDGNRYSYPYVGNWEELPFEINKVTFQLDEAGENLFLLDSNANVVASFRLSKPVWSILN